MGLFCVNSAVAIDVPGGTFDEYYVGGAGGWKYVKDITGGDWSATTYSGNPWIGNTYGNGYPVLGHSGAQFVDLNAGYIHQALPGETYDAYVLRMRAGVREKGVVK